MTVKADIQKLEPGSLIELLAPFGVKLDEQKNDTRSKEPRIISAPDSKVTVAVIPTNEELAIARKSAAIAAEGKDTYGNVFSR